MINEFGQAIGEPVTTALPAGAPPTEPMDGRFCDVVALQPRHADDLWSEFTAEPDDREWTYLSVGPFESQAEFADWVAAMSGSTDDRFVAVLDASTGRAIGMAAYLRIAPAAGSIEVGHVHFGASLRGTSAATEAMYLMMRSAFDSGYRRYEWKCDSLNEPSRRAARRLGFTYEGTFRNAVVYKGRSRDTAWFSIIDTEWPAARAEFERWLDPENFDDQGHQRTPLTTATD